MPCCSLVCDCVHAPPRLSCLPLQGEMAALQEAPGVIAVCKKFRASATARGSPQQEQLSAAQSQLHSDSSSTSSSSNSIGSDNSSSDSSSEAGSPRAAGTAGGSGSRGASPAAELLVEIDVVADYGLTWIGRAHGVGGREQGGCLSHVGHVVDGGQQDDVAGRPLHPSISTA